MVSVLLALKNDYYPYHVLRFCAALLRNLKNVNMIAASINKHTHSQSMIV